MEDGRFGPRPSSFVPRISFFVALGGFPIRVLHLPCEFAKNPHSLRDTLRRGSEAAPSYGSIIGPVLTGIQYRVSSLENPRLFVAIVIEVARTFAYYRTSVRREG